MSGHEGRNGRGEGMGSTEEAVSLIGWCVTHDSMAEVYDDGSIGCHYLTIIESYSDDCRMEPIVPERLYRGDEKNGPAT